MEDIVGDYEMSVIPRSNFSPDGSMLLTVDKSSLMTLIIKQTPLQVETPLPGNRPQVLIIDAMPEVKSLIKQATTTRLDSFIQRVNRKIQKTNYSEVYTAFVEWSEESLKDKTRVKRAANQPGSDEQGPGFDMHDGMCLKKTSVADLLATNKSKTQTAEYFAKSLVKEYRGRDDIKMVVTHSGQISVNEPHTLPQDFITHNHEEADTQIP